MEKVLFHRSKFWFNREVNAWVCFIGILSGSSDGKIKIPCVPERGDAFQLNQRLRRIFGCNYAEAMEGYFEFVEWTEAELAQELLNDGIAHEPSFDGELEHYQVLWQ